MGSMNIRIMVPTLDVVIVMRDTVKTTAILTIRKL